ncbi:MAG TPA: cytochrome bc complex cytochrome b subunit [Chloroflexi bacterium]|nr:cytochrome bc complex cytochrome b subunit [Chloroflexota bacterium]
MQSNLDIRDFPLIKRIRESGLQTALLETADDVVQRVTAGLNIADLRSMLRGDPPGRPNPRLRPHADSFWMHMRPGYYNQAVTGLYPTFRLGFLSTFFFALEGITGLFLMVFYTPSTEYAYADMLNILSNVPLGQFMRDLHRLGAEAMVIIVALHMLRTYITASYKKPRQFTWATGIILLIVTLAFSYTGYLLPWDQLAYWAVTIGASMAEAAPPPVVGQFVNILLKGAPDLGAAGLLRFYLLHVFALPAIGTIFLGVHYYKVILHGHSLPPEDEKVGEDTAKRVPPDVRRYYLPDIQAAEVLWVGVTMLALIVAVIFFYDAPLENHANPLSTPLHTVAPWYFLWIQGLLKLGDKTLMGVIIPTILALSFLVMPYFDVGPFRQYGKRRIAISLSLIFITAIVILSWMGTPKFLVQTSLDQEIFFELAPSEKVGLVRAVPYDELIIGAYNVDDYETSVPRSSGLWRVMRRYSRMIEHARQTPPEQGGLPNAEAFLIVEQLQPNLKGVILRITWDDPDNPGERLSAELLVPVHRDAYPLGGE